jgi:hypothetical protein
MQLSLAKVGMGLYAWNYLEETTCSFCFTVDGIDLVALASSTDHLLKICNVALRLLAASAVHSVRLTNRSPPYDMSIHATSLAYLMEQCQSLKLLTLQNLKMDENQCRVLGAYSRPDLEIVLYDCTISDAGASALAEILGRNQGPTKLVLCEIDNLVLADGVRGNSRLKSWSPHLSDNHNVDNRQIIAVAGALREYKGLVDLDLSCYGFKVNDETWGALCDSLMAHPTLEVLDLRFTGWMAAPAPAVLRSRMQALLDMMEVNMSIHTIRLDCPHSQHEIFRGSVIPYLETDRLRPRLLAIQRTRPIPYRAKVLGRALLSARTNPNRFRMLLSGNADVAFPSRTTTTANLNTSATAATSTTATVAAVASISPAAAASSVVAPVSGQMRKGSP